MQREVAPQLPPSPTVTSTSTCSPSTELVDTDGLEMANSIGRLVDTHDFKNAIHLFQSASPPVWRDALMWQDARGDSLLHKAIDAHAQLRFKSSHDGSAEQLIVMLLKKNANPNAVNLRRQTPLHAAAMGGNMELCKVLIRYKARLDVVDARGKRPEDTARHHRHQQLAEFLQQQAAASHGSLEGSVRQDGGASRSPLVVPRHATPPFHSGGSNAPTTAPRQAVASLAPAPLLGDGRSLADRYHNDEARRLRDSQEMKWRLEDLREKNHALHSALFTAHQAKLVALHRCGFEKLQELENAAFSALLMQSALATDCMQLEQQLHHVSSELQACSDTLSSTTIVKEQLAETVETLEAQRAEAISSASSMMEELSTLRDERSALIEQVAQLESQSAAASSVLTSTAEELRQAIATCTAAMDERDAAAARASKHEAQVVELTAAVGTMDAAMSAATRRCEAVDAIEAELAAVTSQLTALKEAHTAQDAILQSHTAQSDAMRLALDSLQQELAQMTKERDAAVQASAAEQQQHEEAVKQLDKANRLLSDQLAAVVASAEASSSSSGGARSDVAANVEWQDKCRQVEDKLAIATQQLVEKESRLAAMATVHRVHAEGAAAAEAAARAAEAVASQRLQANNALEAKLRSMSNELETVTKQLTEATRKLSSATADSKPPADAAAPLQVAPPVSVEAPSVAVHDAAPPMEHTVDVPTTAQRIATLTEQLQAEKSESLQRLRLLENRLLASHHESESRRVDVETWKRKHHEVTVALEQLQGVRAQVQRLEADNAALAQQVATMQSSVDVQEHNAQLQADLSSLRLEMMTMRSNRHVGMSELRDQTARAEALEQRLAALQSAHQQLGASHKTALLRLEALDRMQGDNAILQGELNELRRSMHDRDTTVAVLEHDHRYQSERIQSLEAQLAQERRCFAAVEEQVAAKGIVREEALWRREVMVAQLHAAMALQHDVASLVTSLAVRALQTSALRSARQPSHPSTVRKSFDPTNSELLVLPTAAAALPTSSRHNIATASSIAVRAVSSLRHHYDAPLVVQPHDVDRMASSASCCHSASTANEDEELGITHDDSADDLLPPPTTASVDAACDSTVAMTNGTIRPVATPPEIRSAGSLSLVGSRPFQRNRPASAVVGSRQPPPNPQRLVDPSHAARLGMRCESHPSGLLWSTGHSSIRGYYVNQCAIHGVKPLAVIQDMLPDEPLEAERPDEASFAAGAAGAGGHTPPTNPVSAASKVTVLSVAHGKHNLCRASMRALIDLLRVCPRLQTLDFSGTSASDAALAYLALTVEAMLGFVDPTPYSDDNDSKLAACRQRAVRVLALKELVLDGTLVSNIDHVTHVATLVPTLTTVGLTRCKLLRDTSRPALDAQLRANATCCVVTVGGVAQATSLASRPDPSSAFGLPNQMGLHLGRFRRPASAAAVRPAVPTPPPSLSSPSFAAGRHQPPNSIHAGA